MVDIVKRQLEQNLLKAADKTPSKASDCANELDESDLLSAWYNLSEYYKSSDDDYLSVEVVREYLHWINIYSYIEHDETRSDECRDRAQEYLVTLEHLMQDIIKAVEHRLYPYGR